MPPAGFKRSRALWDETSRSQETVLGTLRVWFRAIAYELQPVRFNYQANQRQLKNLLQGILQTLYYVVVSLPGLAKSLFVFVKGRTRRQWMVVGAVLLYYGFVRWIHEYVIIKRRESVWFWIFCIYLHLPLPPFLHVFRILDAGPLVVILTSLVAIFTVGLGDENSNNGLSAYSVFNRGFERLMGSVDVDSLLAQHVGMGMGAGGAAMMRFQGNDNDNDDPPPARARRPPPARNNEDNNHNPQNDSDSDNDDDAGNGPLLPADNRARKSGKKARRRNLEQRREIRRQREAAMELGVQGVEGPDEMIAMQRLLEEQIVNENENGGNHQEA
jgi:hypothetical protein